MDSTSAYIYGTGTPAEQVNLSTGKIIYLVTDSLGSVRGVVSGSGALTATISYDAWGNPETAGGLTAYTPFGYAGAYTDPTGLIYLINRYYDPATGQFLSVDPDVSSTQAPYSYAQGDPVSNLDPSGLATEKIPNPAGCWARMDDAHWQQGKHVGKHQKGAVKVNGSIFNCLWIPEYARIKIKLWKAGFPLPHIQAATDINTNQKGEKFRRGKNLGDDATYIFQNQGTLKECKYEEGDTTDFFGTMGALVEEEGTDYTTTQWPDEWLRSTTDFPAENCWTNSPG